MSDTRVNDPDTGNPFPEPSRLHKFVAWMWAKYSRKLLLKIGVVTAPVVGMIAARFGNTPSAQEAIGIGVSALVLGALDCVVSYVGRRMGLTNLESLQKLSEEQEPIREQPAIPYTSDSGRTFTRSAMFDAVLKQNADSRPMTPAESKASAAAFNAEMEVEEALAALRASRAPTQRINLPTQAELDATKAKLHGFSVEVYDPATKESSVKTYTLENSEGMDPKTAACLFKFQAQADGKRATLLF